MTQVRSEPRRLPIPALSAVYPVDHRPPFDLTREEDRHPIDLRVRNLEPSFADRETILLRTESARIITDGNMGTEWQT